MEISQIVQRIFISPPLIICATYLPLFLFLFLLPNDIFHLFSSIFFLFSSWFMSAFCSLCRVLYCLNLPESLTLAVFLSLSLLLTAAPQTSSKSNSCSISNLGSSHSAHYLLSQHLPRRSAPPTRTTSHRKCALPLFFTIVFFRIIYIESVQHKPLCSCALIYRFPLSLSLRAVYELCLQDFFL
jgi:hypothetical protein